MSMEYEFISHRSNVSFLGTGSGAGENFLDLHNDRLSVYAERCYSLGKYGGDAYPVVWEKESGGRKYGLVLAADGVGQASFEHPSLKERLDEKLKEEFEGVFPELSEEELKKLRLFTFLKELLGIDMLEINDDKAAEEELAYAMRSFSDIPVAGYFGGTTTDENGSGVDEQACMPFYERQSQAIGSRLTCVWIFKLFRSYALDKNLEKWTPTDVDELRKAISKSLYGEGEDSLVSRTRKYFSYDDTQKADRKNFYFLPSTVAAWFYIVDGSKISAVALNCGDARCYKVDLIDGVKQISDDDISTDGDTMSAFVHYGQVARLAANGFKDYYDNTFRAAIVELEAPCALFACSDGIYDTCPEEWTPSNASLGNPNADCSDVLFEYRMLKAFRRTYSLDDLSDEVVYSFYGQNAPHGLEKKFRSDSVKSGKGMNVKRDDSGTFAAKFFSTNGDPFEIFDSLREKNDTTLDKLIAATEKYRIPVKDMHWQAPTAMGEEKFADRAKEWVRSADFLEVLLEKFQKEDMIARKAKGEETYYGAKVQRYNPSLPQAMFFKANAAGIVTYMLKSPECKDDPKVQALLEKYEVEKAYKEAMAPKINYSDEEARQTHEALMDAFYGDLAKRAERDDIIVDHGRNVEGFDADIEAKIKNLHKMKAEEDVQIAADKTRSAAEEAKKAAEEAKKAEEAAERALEEDRSAQDVAELANASEKAAAYSSTANGKAKDAFAEAKRIAETIEDSDIAPKALEAAQQAASDAQKYCDEALNSSDKARSRANAAKAKEDDLNKKLQAIKERAQKAKDAALAAQTKAENASKKAEEAKQKADQTRDAQEAANYAQEAETYAKEAQDAAEEAGNAVAEAKTAVANAEEVLKNSGSSGHAEDIGKFESDANSAKFFAKNAATNANTFAIAAKKAAEKRAEEEKKAAEKAAENAAANENTTAEPSEEGNAEQLPDADGAESNAGEGGSEEGETDAENRDVSTETDTEPDDAPLTDGKAAEGLNMEEPENKDASADANELPEEFKSEGDKSATGEAEGGTYDPATSDAKPAETSGPQKIKKYSPPIKSTSSASSTSEKNKNKDMFDGGIAGRTGSADSKVIAASTRSESVAKKMNEIRGKNDKHGEKK